MQLRAAAAVVVSNCLYLRCLLVAQVEQHEGQKEKLAAVLRQRKREILAGQRKLVKQYFKYHNRPTIGHRCIVLLMTDLA